jgi:hypothetical protein
LEDTGYILLKFVLAAEDIPEEEESSGEIMVS